MFYKGSFFISVELKLYTQWEQVEQLKNVSLTPLQTAQKSSTRIIWGEVTLMEGLPSQENKAEADKSVVKKLVEVPEESAMGNIFTEVQVLAGTGPNSQLIQVS